MNRPSHGTVEALLSQLDELANGSNQTFEVWAPEQMTLRGQPVPVDVAMAIILDKILSRGYEPNGFAGTEGGRVYRYKIS